MKTPLVIDEVAVKTLLSCGECVHPEGLTHASGIGEEKICADLQALARLGGDCGSATKFAGSRSLPGCGSIGSSAITPSKIREISRLIIRRD